MQHFDGVLQVFLIYTLNHNRFISKVVGFHVYSFSFRDLGLGQR